MQEGCNSCPYSLIRHPGAPSSSPRPPDSRMGPGLRDPGAMWLVSAEAALPAAMLPLLLFPKPNQKLLSQRWASCSGGMFVSPCPEPPHSGAPACPLAEQTGARKGPKGRAGPAEVGTRDS